MTNEKLNPWLAVLFAFVFPGGGYVYAGQMRLAVTVWGLLVGVLAFELLLIFGAMSGPATTSIFPAIAFVLVPGLVACARLFELFHTFVTANDVNRGGGAGRRRRRRRSDSDEDDRRARSGKRPNRRRKT